MKERSLVIYLHTGEGSSNELKDRCKYKVD